MDKRPSDGLIRHLVTVARNDFAPIEYATLARDLLKLERPAAKARQREAGKRGKEGGRGKKKNPSAKFSQGLSKDANRAVSRVAKPVGVSRPTLEKTWAVMDDGERERLNEWRRGWSPTAG